MKRHLFIRPLLCVCIFTVKVSGNDDDFLNPMKDKGYWGFANKQGNQVIKPHYDSVQLFSQGLAPVRVNATFGFIDKKGQLIIDEKYNKKWGYIDRNETMVIEPVFDRARAFGYGIAVVARAGAWELIDKNGRKCSKVRFDAVYAFSDGLALVKVRGKYGYVDTLGREVIKPRYDSARPFANGMAKVARKGRVMYINKKGKEIKKLKMSSAIDDCGNLRPPVSRPSPSNIQIAAGTARGGTLPIPTAIAVFRFAESSSHIPVLRLRRTSGHLLHTHSRVFEASVSLNRGPTRRRTHRRRLAAA
jgi:hypothetical protein